MTTAYFDCFGGAAGDMIVATLLSAGAWLAALREQLARLPLAGYTLSAESVTRGSIAGVLFDVRLDDAHDDHHHGRNLDDIFGLLDQARYGDRADGRIRRIFRRLAVFGGLGVSAVRAMK